MARIYNVRMNNLFWHFACLNIDVNAISEYTYSVQRDNTIFGCNELQVQFLLPTRYAYTNKYRFYHFLSFRVRSMLYMLYKQNHCEFKHAPNVHKPWLKRENQIAQRIVFKTPWPYNWFHWVYFIIHDTEIPPLLWRHMSVKTYK